MLSCSRWFAALGVRLKSSAIRCPESPSAQRRHCLEQGWLYKLNAVHLLEYISPVPRFCLDFISYGHGASITQSISFVHPVHA